MQSISVDDQIRGGLAGQYDLGRLSSSDIARTQLAREVHDQMGWHLTAFNYELLALESDPGNLGKIASLRVRLNDLGHALRGLTSRLRCETGLAGDWEEGHEDDVIVRIGHLARDWSRITQIPAVIKLSGGASNVGRECAAIIIAILTELLTNVAKHAATASYVRIGFHVSGSDALWIEFSDDGPGINLARIKQQERQSFGLTGIQERLALVMGSLDIDCGPEGGSRITIRIPYARF